MANPKWVKWAVGISSVALFTGMVGIINHSSATLATAPGSNDIVNSSPAGGSIQGDDNTGIFQQRPITGRGRSGGFSSGTGSTTDEGMRTHAS
jgi:hypothetical protein